MTTARTICLEAVLPHPPARVWRALTDSRLIARWLMPNDFQLVVGHRFTMHAVPVPSTKFSGVVYCQVLAFERERMLRYSWDDDTENGLHSTVTWHLHPVDGGTTLRLEHAGFDPHSAVQQRTRRLMGSGWPRVFARLMATLHAPDEATRYPYAEEGERHP